MKDLLVIIIAVPVIAAFIVSIPLISIWALNTLFPQLSIPYNLYTWLAAAWVTMVVSSTVNRN
jgi:hypothetical protein